MHLYCLLCSSINVFLLLRDRTKAQKVGGRALLSLPGKSIEVGICVQITQNELFCRTSCESTYLCTFCVTLVYHSFELNLSGLLKFLEKILFSFSPCSTFHMHKSLHCQELQSICPLDCNPFVHLTFSRIVHCSEFHMSVYKYPFLTSLAG